ncbi:23S rRNA (adenine(1618)-N(6))-methyltransferase RlmF [Solitalea lacus]|uniref:23S rRNA (adenine(1618)-N(6))-methyltransferase RlmF n=1 Tax=Solitalea lacus TaxID=2911172 RepID=UPI001EDBEFF6|nr:23S rRNA (adenine(1618)-N(6))-methyltransferase RlmF [Solitalea lacus]UKJ08762.1 23S rRNA (adenine(1618)-N(6))-methyltransferase RlmF [Solitalea lacus]
MKSTQSSASTEKNNLHQRNKHRSRYNFRELVESCPELKAFVAVNKFGDESIDFANPSAVKTLNKALLKHFYGVFNWDIPRNYLCPPIPGRADYIHYVADLLSSVNNGVIPTGKNVSVLDIGVGANCIYPIIGVIEYDWHFVGADIDKKAIQCAREIVASNPTLENKIECRLQSNPLSIFKGIVQSNERFHLSVCNPPFHTSEIEASAGTRRKLTNLGKGEHRVPVLNFGGKHNELWCEGGEFEFVKRMINESAQLSESCLWFTSLVSKSEHLKGFYKLLERAEALEVKTINMAQGNKISRILAWTFTPRSEYKNWFKKNN